MSITFECMNGFSKFKISQKAEKISCEISMLPASGARALAHFLTLGLCLPDQGWVTVLYIGPIAGGWVIFSNWITSWY